MSCPGFPVILDYLVNEEAGGTVAVNWEHPFGGVCPVVKYKVYYRELFSQKEKSAWSSVTVDRNKTSYTLQLHCWKEYQVTVISLNTFGETAVHDSQVRQFKTRGGN